VRSAAFHTCRASWLPGGSVITRPIDRGIGASALCYPASVQLARHPAFGQTPRGVGRRQNGPTLASKPNPT
jgi:hypothetical protein